MRPGSRPSVVVFGGPTATIENTPPLLTSKSAFGRGGDRGVQHGLRAQRLATGVEVLVEAYSAHPLEADVAHLYREPDCHVDSAGNSVPADSPGAIPAYRVTLARDDGLFLLPYLARRVDGSPFTKADTMSPGSVEDWRQTFYPSAARLVEEIDRFGVDNSGESGIVSSLAKVTTLRVAPSGGYRGVSPAEVAGTDFFPYQPTEFAGPPDSSVLAQITNAVQQTLATGDYDGAIWLEGSPFIEETSYWLNLLIDTTVPICGNAAQRPHGTLSNDGDRNLVDSLKYIRSAAWADAQNHDRVGVVLVQDQLIISAREVNKVAARPGGYRASGGTGGIVGMVADSNNAVVEFLPVRRHTHQSALRTTLLPATVWGTARVQGRIQQVQVAVKNADGGLAEAAIPAVGFVKIGRYHHAADPIGPDAADILRRVEAGLDCTPLSGFILEGSCPYGHGYRNVNEALSYALFCGVPTVRVGRGNTEDYVPANEALDQWNVPGSNLTATKARILLMACLLKFGAAPPAADPYHPTAEERRQSRAYLDAIGEVFRTH